MRNAYDTLRDSLIRGLRGWFSPRTPRHERPGLWALKDVSFSVAEGEIVGLIGPNGVGKSTLLKILTRVTAPTTGRVEVRGRVASLLEVGTGFHPELTGRENIYLNGVLLGMTHRKVSRRFDEIVDFAGVESFIDTPVKRYSSGMAMRLAFSVAAHLDSDLLLVDEVLAVGDAHFQEKCLDTMGDVAKQGRTIVFVSHNMAAMRALCSRGLLIRKGEIVLDSNMEACIAGYLATGPESGAEIRWHEDDAPRTDFVRLVRAFVEDAAGEPATVVETREPFTIALEYDVLELTRGMRTGFVAQNQHGVSLFGSTDYREGAAPLPPGRYQSRCRVPGDLLNAGRVSVAFSADRPPHRRADLFTEYCVSFKVDDALRHGPLRHKLPGVLRPALVWSVERHDD